MAADADFKDDRKILETLMKTKVQRRDVGFFDEKNAQKAFNNELGTYDPKKPKEDQKGKIPERPFMRQSVTDNQDAITEKVMESFENVVKGTREQVDLAPAGELLATKMKLTGIHFDDPENAPSTIKRKGFDDPLVETGEMLGSIKSRRGTNKDGDI